MAGKWYYSHEGTEYGPYSPKELRELVLAGKLLPTDLIGQRGRSRWTPAQKVRGLFPPKGILVTEKGRAKPGVMSPIPLANEPLPPEPRADLLFDLEPEPDDLPEAEASGIVTIVEPEPWYYRFLERYAKASLAGGVLCGILLGVLVLVWRLTAPDPEALMRSLLGPMGGLGNDLKQLNNEMKQLGIGDLGNLGGLNKTEDASDKVMWCIGTVLLPIITCAAIVLFAFLQAAVVLLVLDVGRSLRRRARLDA